MTRTLRGLGAASRARLRARAMLLKDAGHDDASIGIKLGIMVLTARTLCLPDRQQARRQSSRTGLLPQPVIDLFVHGSYADLVARSTSTRMRYLAKIGSLYTKAELLRERGVGRATVTRVQNWLAAQGYRLRRSNESVAEAVCRDGCRNSPRLSQPSRRHEVGDARAGLARNSAKQPALERRDGYERHQSPSISDYGGSPSYSKALH